MKVSKADHGAAVAKLRELLPPGSTVYSILRHVSRSGMQRRISFYCIADRGFSADPRPEPVFLDGYVATALGMSCHPSKDGLTVNGCGMDMGFHVVYSLSYALFGGKGWTCSGERCPSNDHLNGDRDYSPHQHKDGGYALSHKWL